MSFHIEHSVLVGAEAGAVCDYLVDLRNEMEWYEGIRSVLLLEGPPPGQGARFEVVFEALGRTMSGLYTITDYARGSRIAADIDQGAVQVKWRAALQAEGAGTRVTFVFDVETRGLVRLFAGKIRGAMAAGVISNMDALKRRMEGGPVQALPSAAPR